ARFACDRRRAARSPRSAGATTRSPLRARISARLRATAAARLSAAARAAAQHRAERLRKLVALRVLQAEHVDAALAAGRHVDALDELEQPQIIGLVGDDDELVVALVGEDAPLALAARGAGVGQLAELGGQLVGGHVVHRL